MMNLEETIKYYSNWADLLEEEANSIDLTDRVEMMQAEKNGESARECRQREKWLRQVQESKKILLEWEHDYHMYKSDREYLVDLHDLMFDGKLFGE